MFLFTFIPGFYILFGTVYAIPYEQMNWLSIFLLYLFVMGNLLIENYLKSEPIDKIKNKKNKRPVFIIELIVWIILIYFGWSTSLVLGIVLFCLLLFIQGQMLFKYYQLTFFSLLIVTFIKATLLNLTALYIHTGFLSWRSLLFTFPLIAPILLHEWHRMYGIIEKKILYCLIVLSYLSSLIYFTFHMVFVSAVLLFSLPLAYFLIKNPEKGSIRLFTAGFLLLHFIGCLLLLIL